MSQYIIHRSWASCLITWIYQNDWLIFSFCGMINYI
uniref:Uncharacterized protein n=1 Tax=Rhizophora mucronata TaxID=61149 RepID=A0A2P2P7H4_RHIMU